ncbi:MAG: hypothetical protein HQ522_10470 [Bacteroidetes bacterium]|nr:hypothetical protein [Bacteroidota bacterium]
MKTEKLLKVCGSITKTESLIPIQFNILEQSWIAEANLPYSHYYGQVPKKAKPNSVFLFTKRFFSLEEVLRFSIAIEGYSDKLNIASATIEHQNRQYPAIRIKKFPDYEHLHLLQKCFVQQGVELGTKVNFVTKAKTVINKCFELQELDEDIYLDNEDENKGYIFVQKRIDRDNFDKLILKVKNNGNCKFFDAVPGGLIIDSKSKDIIRIFAEGLNLELLKCIKYELRMNFESYLGD